MDNKVTDEMVQEIKKSIIQANQEACDKGGATHEELIKKLIALTEATEVKTKCDRVTGKWFYSVPIYQNGIRLDAIKTLLELRGEVPPKQQEHKITGAVPMTFAEANPAQLKAVKAFEQALIKETFHGPEPDDSARS